MARLIEMALAPLKRRVMLMVSRGVIRLVNDGLKLQGLQVELLAGEVADGVEHFQQYGFTSVPEDGAEAIVLAVGGNRSHLVVIATGDRKHRKSGMTPGEVAVYTRYGNHIHLKADGSVEVLAPGGMAVTGDLTVTGDIAAMGDVADGTGTIQAMRDVFNPHVHPEQNGVGGPNTLLPTTQMQ